MQYSIGVEYALHCLVYLANLPVRQPVGIKDLAEFQGVSESYLSKIFTKLAKDDIVRSTPGVKGGYELARSPAKISFWDVVEAVEGRKPIFQCRNIIEKGILNKEAAKDTGPCQEAVPCRINLTMLEAEQVMQQYLQEKTLLWLVETLQKELPQEKLKSTGQWFASRMQP